MDLHSGGVSKNHPALGGGIGLWFYQLAGIAEDSTPGGTLVLRPMRETLQEVGSAEVGLVTPQGEVRNLDRNGGKFDHIWAYFARFWHI